MCVQDDGRLQPGRREAIRSLLAFCLTSSTLVARASSDPVCPAGDDQSGLRESLHYTESSDDHERQCHLCSFFSPGDDPRCGHCQILGGSVNKNGRCDSWSARS